MRRVSRGGCIVFPAYESGQVGGTTSLVGIVRGFVASAGYWGVWGSMSAGCLGRYTLWAGVLRSSPKCSGRLRCSIAPVEHSRGDRSKILDVILGHMCMCRVARSRSGGCGGASLARGRGALCHKPPARRECGGLGLRPRSYPWGRWPRGGHVANSAHGLLWWWLLCIGL
jgi:hypothetical protein